MGFQKLTEPLPLTDKCHHYQDVSEVPEHLKKYYQQRYSLFHYYDHDIYLTDDAWFGVTPEPIALQIADELPEVFNSLTHTEYAQSARNSQKATIVDLFAGVGGNVIAFALSNIWSRIIAIEKDPDTLACAMHNAQVYEVYDRITWVLGDCFDFLPAAKDGQLPDDVELDEDLRIDRETTTIYGSPPWGGVSYRDHQVFDLALMEPYNLQKLSEACRPWEYSLFLPRTSDLRQLAKLAPRGEKIEVVQYCMEGASKALVVYVPQDEGA